MAVPKNIKQIGEPERGLRVYIEDYVYTYLHTTEKQTGSGRQPAILVGTRGTEGDESVLYISGAVTMEVLEYDNGRLIISEQMWSEVYSQCKNYYERKEILGWYYPAPEKKDNLMVELERAHRIYFPGQDKILLMAEWEEQEESIYRVNNGVFKPIKGYYIYYEKNVQMQEYMVTRKASETIGDDRKEIFEAERRTDRAVARYREIVADQIRKEQAYDKARRAVASVFLLAFMGVFTYFMYAGYGKVEYLTKLVNQLETALGITETETGEIRQAEMVQGEVASTNEQTEEEGEGTQDDTEDKDNMENGDEEETGDDAENEEDTENGDETDTDEGDDTEVDEEPEAETTAANTYLEQGYYIVQQGDSLERICKKIYGDKEKLEELCAKNAIENPDEIYEGQKLMLP